MVDYEAEREKSSSQKSQLTRWIARDSTTMPNGDTWPREKEEIQKLRGGRQGGDVHVLLSKSIIIMISYLNSKILHSFLQNLTSFFFYCIFYAYEKNWTYECGGRATEHAKIDSGRASERWRYERERERERERLNSGREGRGLLNLFATCEHECSKGEGCVWDREREEGSLICWKLEKRLRGNS